jgi:hypothetical protein
VALFFGMNVDHLAVTTGFLRIDKKSKVHKYFIVNIDLYTTLGEKLFSSVSFEGMSHVRMFAESRPTVCTRQYS